MATVFEAVANAPVRVTIFRREVDMKAPKIGLLICNSGSSNSGTLTGIAAMEVIKELSSDLIGICSLPALANEIPAGAYRKGSGTSYHR